MRMGRYFPHGEVSHCCDEINKHENEEVKNMREENFFRAGAAGSGTGDDGDAGESLMWSATRGKVRLRVRSVDASSAAAMTAARNRGGGGEGSCNGDEKGRGEGECAKMGDEAVAAAEKKKKKKKKMKMKKKKRLEGSDRHVMLLPALVVVHRPGHFDSLQPPLGRVLILERWEEE